MAALNGTVKYFLGRARGTADVKPERRLAEQINSFVEPIAKDHASQVNIQAGGDVHHHVHYHLNINSEQANAPQNNIRRDYSPQIPAVQTLYDQVMILRQMRFDTSLKTGNQGIIQAVSPKPVHLTFLSPEAKRLILEAHENPYHMVFLVDVVVTAIDGKPTLYQIREVKERFERDT